MAHDVPVPVPPDARVTTVKVRKKTSHTFHLIMSILTCGLWAVFVWWPLTWWHAMGPRKKIKMRHQ